MGRNKGFSLIEMVIAMALLVMILAALMPLFMMSAKTNTVSAETLQAQEIGVDTIESIMNYAKSSTKEQLTTDSASPLSSFSTPTTTTEATTYSKVTTDDYTVEVILSNTDQRIRVRVLKADVVQFETVDWLLYE